MHLHLSREEYVKGEKGPFESERMATNTRELHTLSHFWTRQGLFEADWMPLSGIRFFGGFEIGD